MSKEPKKFQFSGHTSGIGKKSDGTTALESFTHEAARPGPWKILTITQPDGSVRRVRWCSFKQGNTLSLAVGGTGGIGIHGEIQDRPRKGASPSAGGDLTLRFPGKVRKVLIRAGDTVTEGQNLLLLEAMKMEFAIRSPHAGVVKKILVSEGDQVQPGQDWIEIEWLSEKK